MSTPNYREFAYYGYGLGLGARNFLRNGFGAGFRVTASSVLQPVNSYTRFPEYRFLEEAVAEIAAGRGRRLEALDVGSPKLAAFFLASRYDIRIRATDLSPLNVKPYERMWRAVRHKAPGAIEFETQDGRCLTYAEGAFDLVYAMSVLEHIESDGGDRAAVGEMLRVLKPGGRLFLSVPFGSRYAEQKIAGVAHGGERVRTNALFFFQRIYDKRRIESNILDAAGRGSRVRKIVTVFRRASRAASAVSRIRGLPESVVTALGFLNPLVSRALNRHAEGLVDDFRIAYGPIHRFSDVFGDAVIVIDKNPAGGPEAGRESKSGADG